MGGPQFLVSCILSMNGLGISTQSLADTGANGYLFLNRPLAVKLSKSLGVKIQRLPYSVPIRGFQNKIQSHADQYLRLHLTVDGHKVYNCPFVILDLGSQDVIIGIKWMKKFRLKINTQTNQFIWPAEYPPTLIASKDILIRYNSSRPLLKTQRQHQSDVLRRDRIIHEDQLRRDGGAVQIASLRPVRTPGILPRINPPPLPLKPKPPRSFPEPSAKSQRICEISANAFHFNMKRADTEFFQTSLYEIDRVMEEVAEREDPATAELLMEKLPVPYHSYADVFSKSESNRLPPHRAYDHKIHLEAPLPNAFSPLYRQSTSELQATKEYLLENLDKGFIVNSKSPFASPILFVKKSDGSLRFCIDYRKLNSLTRNDPYPIPRIDELLARVSKAKYYTKLDIRQAFHRIRMDPDSEDYTTFRTRYGSYKCKVLPFGLCNGPATYQRYMNDVLLDYLDDFCMAYLDDILIYSEDLVQHELHVKSVLNRLREAGLQADIKKCEFSVTRTLYLGYVLTTKGLEVDPAKVEPLRNWERPTTVTGVKSFLGFCGFYRQFIRNFGLIAKPLSTITRPSEPFRWTTECENSFEKLRRYLLAIPTTHHYNPELPTKLETDASDGVTAGVISQEHPDKQWYPVGFYSHVLSGHEINWEIHDKELFAIVQAFQKWRPELMAATSRVRVYSDHRSLEYFMTTKQLTAKQVRWMEFLSDFNFQIQYTTGKSNAKADILSRREQDLKLQEEVKRDSRARVLLGPKHIDPRIGAELAQVYIQSLSVSSLEASPTDQLRASTDLIQELRDDNEKSFASIRSQDPLPEGYSQQGKLLLFKGRLCVNRLAPLCTRLIKEAHEQVSSAHPSGLKTYQLLAPQYYWFGMGSDCKRFVRNCIACKLSHSNNTKQQGYLHPLPIPEYPMQHLCMDFKEFPKDKNGYDNILVFMDRLSKASVSIPCHKTTNAAGMAQLFTQWIYRFGHTPESIVSDRGPQFISTFWKEFCRIIGVKIKLSTAYHKQTDGQTEIMNKYIDQRLRPFVNHYQDNWSELIPLMDRAQMTLPHATIGMAPYRLKFGLDPRNSWDWDSPKGKTPRESLNRQEALKMATRMHDAWNTAKDSMATAQSKMERSTNKHRRRIDWEVNDKVYLSTKNLKNHRPSKKLAHQWVGPYTVLEKRGNAYRLDLPKDSTIHDVFSPDVLMKAPNDPLPGQEPPEPSGDIIEGVEEWEVDYIQAVRLVRNKLKYQVSWLGYDPDPEWYPASNFIGSPLKLQEFHDKYPDLPGPPRALPEWVKYWGQDDPPTNLLRDDRPVTK
jgi:hypothetical protein